PAANLPLTPVGIEKQNGQVPLRYELAQNYPNPFNPNTTIRFVLPRNDKVKLIVYDLLGRKVKTLIHATMSSGRHVAMWDGTDDYGYPVASGMYFYKLKTKHYTKVRKMVLMK
ncbi:hypothetical protein B1H10_01290, partial [candidate division KSB1 bacterium 4484_188]